MEIEPIVWDSDFFLLKIGKINPKEFNKPDFEKQKDRFDLIYIFESPESGENKEISSTGAILVDVKKTYKRRVRKNILPDKNISVYVSIKPNEKIYSLALQSGIFSRFKTDLNFPAGSYEKLYHEWILKSCDKSMALCVLVYGSDTSPEGLVTIQGKNNEAQIGLIAVNENTRGRGIGKKLISAAEFIAEKYNFDSLKIVTQSANTDACKLYEKSGFIIQDVVNIYHYWNKNNADTI